jgi:hypothetical protein
MSELTPEVVATIHPELVRKPVVDLASGGAPVTRVDTLVAHIKF